MKHFTYKYNSNLFDFYIFGDRIFTDLAYFGHLDLGIGSSLINSPVYTNIKTYLKQLEEVQNPNNQGISLMTQYNINDISEIIKSINECWEENKKAFPNERNDFITEVSQEQFLPLIASHTLNKELVDYFSNLNNKDINSGLIQNTLLSTEQAIELLKQEPTLGHYLIQDTSYKISPELLHFFVEQDKLNHEADDKYRFSNNIINYRNNLTEQEIVTILPAFRDNVISKVIIGQNLPQYINESLIFSSKNLRALSILSVKYKHQAHIIDRLIYLQTGGRALYQLFDTVNLSGNDFRLASSFLI